MSVEPLFGMDFLLMLKSASDEGSCIVDSTDYAGVALDYLLDCHAEINRLRASCGEPLVLLKHADILRAWQEGEG